MKTGMLQFDGIEYLNGSSSDPKALGWMQGAPPPPTRLIRFQDDRFLEFPQIRWSLSHMRELAPTAAVWRGSGDPSDLGFPAGGGESAIDALKFEDLHGRELTWAQALQDTYTDGIILLHRGRRIYERYSGALQPHQPHACFSITKSYAATLAATLVHERILDENQLIPYYLPEMHDTAYADATLRQVMDMQIGVAYSELYSDPKTQFWDYARAGGLRPRPAGYAGSGSLYEYLQTLVSEGSHGAGFVYKTINTEVMCWVMRRVTGLAFQDMLSQRIWSRIGCEEDGYLTVDPTGVAMGGAGLNAGLRDLARFGELMRCEGAWHGRQIIPAEVVSDIRRGADPAKFATAGYTLLPGYSYRNMWWVSHNSLGVYEGRGIHGQRLYIATEAELVIARFCSHPIAGSAANDPITLPAFAAICRLLMKN